jgi:hypothetical protein
LPSKIAQAEDVLDGNRERVAQLVREQGAAATLKLLQGAQRDLEKRLAQAEGLRGPGAQSFTATQLRATLAQVRQQVVLLNRQMRGLLLDHGTRAGQVGARDVARYMVAADAAFRGVGTQPLALNLARMMSAASQGSEASILRRLAGDDAHPARAGVLERYGMQTVGHFEGLLQRAVVARKSVAEVREDLTEASPFLQGAPRYWADRIVRTELQGAHNRGQWESIREADDQLGDMCKIMSAVFDERTAADSYAVHGQIRRPDEPFETWEGFFMHPPARPNDREAVTPHRVAWAIPPYLAWRDDEEVAARWLLERGPKTKAKMPPRPLMTTIPLEQFGQPPEKSSESPVEE